MREELIQSIEQIIGNPKSSESEILQRLMELHDSHIQEMYPVETVSLADLVQKGLQSMVERTGAIRTGFKDLDALIGGFNEGELVIIGGRPAMGKTQLLINLSLNISQTAPVLYFSLDLSEQMLAARLMTSITDIECHTITTMLLPQHDWLKIDYRLQSIENNKLSAVCSIYSLGALKTYCMKEVEQNNTKVVMIDNIQAIKADKYFRNRDESVGYVCHELKKLARELQILIIVLSNLNRSSEYRNSLDKHPQLADLRESGSLEQCADKVLFIHRPEYYKIYEDECGNDLTDIVEIIVAKNRNGRIGDVQLQKTRNFTNIKDKDTLPSTGIPFPEDRLKEIEDCPY